ncbi:Uncharacterised protein [Porphyromonas endodontalis]|nr:Uncharacterised protein [Porphyromonas endodontalis]
MSELPSMSRVSIHAPLKGATDARVKNNPFSVVSIHAPLKGATLKACFKLISKIVSIHAPLKGATFTEANVIKVSQFQFTHP